MTSARFIKVRCSKCKNEQIVFSKSASNVACLVCNTELSKSSGGKSQISGQVLEVLN